MSIHLRNALLLATLFGVALLLRADAALPVHARVPGMLVLAALGIFLAFRDVVKVRTPSLVPGRSTVPPRPSRHSAMRRPKRFHD